MNPSLFPTKGNLLLMKRSLSLAQLGFDLMDRKRNVMVIEMMRLIDKAKAIQNDIDRIFGEAYSALQRANISMGIEQVYNLSYCAPPDESVEIKFRSVMGVELPSVSSPKYSQKPIYGFISSDSNYDEAYISFIKVKQLVVELAEVESAVYRLAVNIKKTKKRANALSDIIIPRSKESIKYISDSLEEKEREEFTRLKVIKVTKSRA